MPLSELPRSYQPYPEPPKKKRWAAGVHASAMSLVTALTTSEGRGWKVTTMGCIVRPVLMRPAWTGYKTQGGWEGEENEPDTRARWRDEDAHGGTGR